MSSKKQVDNMKKKRRIIVLLCIFGILTMLIAGFGLGILTFNILKENGELNNINLNILSTGENKIEEDNNNLSNDIENKVPTPEPSDEPTPTPKPTSNQSSNEVDAPYYIKINYTANVVTVYKKDNSGKYTVPVKAMICSCGTATPTSGVYPITNKYTWRLLERKCLWTVRM